MEVTVQLSAIPVEDWLPPTLESIERALEHSTAREALETALCCDVSLRLSPVGLQEMVSMLREALDAIFNLAPFYRKKGCFSPGYCKPDKPICTACKINAMIKKATNPEATDAIQS